MTIEHGGGSERTGDKVTVVLCCYNQRAYVAHAVESVLGQTHRNIELIVVDNGSTDGSREILAPYAADPRVQLILHTGNASINQRFIEAIARGTGAFVSILYADDYYLPRKLERQLAEFATLPPDYGVVYSPGYRLDAETGHQWRDASLSQSGYLLEEMMTRHFTDGFINPISPLMRRECYQRYPFYDDIFTEGEAIYMRFALTFKFKYVDEPLTVMREHQTNIGKAVKKNAVLALILMDRLSQERDFPPAMAPALDRFRAEFMGVCSWLGIRVAADPGWARTCALAAIRQRPWQLLRGRTLAALAMSAFPAAGLRAFNRVMNAVRRHNQSGAFRADYT